MAGNEHVPANEADGGLDRTVVPAHSARVLERNADQVCKKWLKDRKGRTLSKDDLTHYQKIVVALNETIRLMKEIDETIEKHGGWPGAFVTGQKEGPAT